MPALSNTRHEKYAQALAQGMSATDAMADAGYSDPRNSTRLTKNDEIAARVAELQARGAVRAAVTASKLIEYANEARELALKTNQPGAAVTAIKEMGILAGVRVEKRENMNRGLNDMSDDELARIARGGSSDDPGAEGRTSKPH